MKTILLGLITVLLNFSAFECSAQKASRLPAVMPENVEIGFNNSGGMIFAYTKIGIRNQTMTVEEKTGNEPKPRKWSAKIEQSEQENLYQLFVENRFDAIKNDEQKGIVYDAGSESVSISAGTNFSYGVTYGPNSPLSGDNLKRYQKIANAINALRTKYEGKARKTSDVTFAVLNLGEEEFTIWFKDSYPAKLSGNEIAGIKTILKKAVDEYNVKPTRGEKIGELEEYKFQFVALFNPKGEKEVWVNAFCNDFERNWQNEIIGVKDGGSCYFNFYVNLNKQTFDRFYVNGSA